MPKMRTRRARFAARRTATSPWGSTSAPIVQDGAHTSTQTAPRAAGSARLMQFLIRCISQASQASRSGFPVRLPRKEFDMRRRIYWLLPDLASARRTMDDLLLARIAEQHLHFVAR